MWQLKTTDAAILLLCDDDKRGCFYIRGVLPLPRGRTSCWLGCGCFGVSFHPIEASLHIVLHAFGLAKSDESNTALLRPQQQQLNQPLLLTRLLH
jgi:hypothetical protein